MRYYNCKKYRLKEVKLVFSLAMLVLVCNSNVWGQKQKIPKKERIETTYEKSETKKHDSLCNYEWLNDKKVFLNLHKGDTIRLDNTKKIKNIKRIIYESYNNDSLPHNLLGNISYYLAVCILPNPKDVPIHIKEFIYSYDEGCEIFPKLTIIDLIKSCQAFGNITSIELSGKRMALNSLPKLVINNSNLINFSINYLNIIPLEMIFNSTLTNFYVFRGPSYPEALLLSYFKKKYISYIPTELERYENQFFYDKDSADIERMTVLPINGEYICYYKDSTPIIKGQFKNGKLDGEWILYYADGTIAQKRYYHEGLETSEWTFYSVYNFEYLRINYENGEEITPTSKPFIHQHKSDTNIIWHVDKNACEFIYEKSFLRGISEFDLEITNKITLIDCNGKKIEENIETKKYGQNKLLSVNQKVYKIGINVKEINLIYDYQLNECIETVTDNHVMHSYNHEIDYKIDSLYHGKEFNAVKLNLRKN